MHRIFGQPFQDSVHGPKQVNNCCLDNPVPVDCLCALRMQAFMQLFANFLNLAEILANLTVLLMLFNLLPIPPLDGAAIVEYFLSPRAAFKFRQIQRYGFLILLLLIWTDILYTFYLGPMMAIVLYGMNLIAGGQIWQLI